MTYYKPKEFAELLNVSVKTLQRWISNESLSPQEELVQHHLNSTRI